MRLTIIGGPFEGVYGGIDFAMTLDHSAFCIVRPTRELNPAWSYEDAVNARLIKKELGPDAYRAQYNVPQYLPWRYTVLHLRRYLAGVDIKNDVTPDAQSVISSPEVQDAGGIQLACDATSMQRFIVKALQHDEDSQLRDTAGVLGVIITAGNGESKGDDGFRNVSKNKLIGLAKQLLAERRLIVNPELKHAALLVDELRNFVPKVTAAGNVTWEADTREGKHDDLLLSTALALYLAAKGREPEFGQAALVDISAAV